MPSADKVRQRKLLSEILEAFELSWQDGTHTPIGTFLQDNRVPRRQLLGELVHIELEYRLKAGEPARVEEYLEQYPELNDDVEQVVELIAAEYRQRRYLEKTLRSEGYLERFPQFREALTPFLESAADTCVLSQENGGPEPTLPAQLGRYRIEGEIARGGMGQVVRVWDEQLDRPLALKVFAIEGAADLAARDRAELVQRFEREAQLMGQLQHPGIPPVQEKGRLDDGRPYFVMKLVQGQSLDDLLRDANLRPAADGSPKGEAGTRFVSIFQSLCDTLAYAHARGIVHRDLKPHNIMVGEFGEVQVLDWGLAKELKIEDRGSRIEDREPRVVCSRSSILDPRSSAQTAAGTVLGTPAYMAPEQARGEVDQLDARCDVFGLGGILCAFLTGQPPFVGATVRTSQLQAMEGDLTGAYARLEACGADPELVQLARRCLAPERADRPANAGEVAAAVARYQTAVQDRLRQAELQRAQAEVKMAEEKKRLQVERQKRRLTLALAVAGLLLILGGSGVALWYVQDQAARTIADNKRLAAEEQQQALLEHGIKAALSQARQIRDGLHEELARPGGVFRLLDQPAQWQGQIREAQALVERARQLQGALPAGRRDAGMEALETLTTQLHQDDRDRQLAVQLEEVRLVGFSAEGQAGGSKTLPEYQRLFAEARLTLAADQEQAFVAVLKHSAIREQLVAALDNWAMVAKRDSPADFPRLLKLARLADPDSLRDQVRDAKVWRDLQALQALTGHIVEDKKLGEKLSPQMYVVLGLLLWAHQADPEPWFRQGLARYPTDFYLHLFLARAAALTHPDRSEGYYRAAVALRPTSVFARNDLGLLLLQQNDPVGAAVAFRKAVALNPQFPGYHHNLGLALKALRDLDGAAAAYRKAIELDPRNAAISCNNLGLLLQMQGNLTGAARAFRKALELDPNYTKAHYSLGKVLQAQGNPAAAAAAYRTAIQLEPGFALAYRDLGQLLLSQGDFANAAAVLRQALQRLPAADPARAMFVTQLKRADRYLSLENKLPAILRGEPAAIAEKLDLAEMCITYQQRYRAAVSLYQNVFTAEPALAADLDRALRYQAARAAVLAASGLGKWDKPPTTGETNLLRRQALDWLSADVRSWREVLASGSSSDLARLYLALNRWQDDRDLASVRDASGLAHLAAEQQQVWRALWSNVRQLLDQTRARCGESKYQDKLTSIHQEQVYKVKLAAGSTCLIDLESTEFDAFLRLEDGQGRVLAENDDVDAASGNLNSRILFPVPRAGVFHVVATSFQHRGTGPYTLTIREFRSGKK